MNKPSTTFSLSSSLLNLSGVEVVDIKEYDKENKVVVVVKSTQDAIKCRQPTRSHGVGRTIRLRHLSLWGKETDIELSPRRGICDRCDGGMSTTEKHDWYTPNSKMTKAYEQHLLLQLVNSTVADVSRKEDIDYHTVDNLISRHIEQEADYSQITDLGVLGLDEISLKKGYQDFVTLITYRVNNKVHILGVVQGREKAAIEAFLSKIPCRLKHTINAVCCDLYEGYINACKTVFKETVPVVADRFHVKKLYHKSLVSLRKAELKRLKLILSEEAYSELKLAIAILRKQRDYFKENEKEVVNLLFVHSPKLKQAYKFSRALSGMFDSDITPEEAKVKMNDWIDEVTASELNCFNRFIKTLSKFETEISHYFLERNTSGFVEGFNNKVKVLKRRCYGISNITKLFQRLILDTQGLLRYAPGKCAI